MQRECHSAYGVKSIIKEMRSGERARLGWIVDRIVASKETFRFLEDI